ncbi:hypothetical protein [Aeoliella mucimassa]|uniref:Uncharacterized protein n=1 Tax=Aeoliella mucimassa TaxID=2527972 RepID=A0A518AKM1_9BACT|nr:hypothetical protein [Aeoliella mucimassa]QDU55277.1 hypothetical protein Pan181_14660 [Aeoliella mucimassa]
MPDPIHISIAMAAAALVAAAMAGVVWLAGRRFAPGSNVLPSVGWLLGIAAGHYVGVWWLGLLPNLQLAEASSRMFWMVLPAVLVVELLGVVPKVPQALVWLLRAALALTVTRVLLHGSTYVANSGSGGDSAQPMSFWVLALLVAGGLLLVWVAVRSSTPLRSACPAPLVLSAVALASSIAIMLSGYATGGQLGLPLAASLAGVFAIALWRGKVSDATPTVGYAVIAIGSLLIIGHYFAELKAPHALLLAASPLVALVPTVPVLGRVPRWGRVAGSLALVLVPLALVLQQAGQTFVERSAPTGQSSSTPSQASVSDYMSFGK